MKKLGIFLLVLIFCGALIVRLYHLNSSVADWHSWRQADTAAVARNFLKFGFDPLKPRYDDLSNVQSGKDNLQGWRMVEFPVYQSLGFGIYQILKFLPGMTIEISLRLISIISSLGIMAILYKITTKELGVFGSLGTLIVFGFLPYSVYYSRVILPETTAVCLALGAVWIGERWVIWGKWGIWGAGIFAGLAVLTKPTAGFLLLPIAYFVIKDWRWRLGNLGRLSLLGILTIGPFLAWRWWIGQFPEGIPANTWLLNGDNIRFTKAFFRWLLFERLIKLILGYWLLLAFIAGSLKIIKSYKKHMTHTLLMIGIIFYAFIFATGNIRHDYYQIIWLPAIAIAVGCGLSLFELKWKIMISLCFVLAFISSWKMVEGYYWINHPEIVEAGKMADKILPKTAKVIAPYGADTAFLYQTNRQGWPVGFEIEKKIAMGADYYINTNVKDAETQYVLQKWTPIEVNDKFVIVKLK